MLMLTDVLDATDISIYNSLQRQSASVTQPEKRDLQTTRQQARRHAPSRGLARMQVLPAELCASSGELVLDVALRWCSTVRQRMIRGEGVQALPLQ